MRHLFSKSQVVGPFCHERDHAGAGVESKTVGERGWSADIPVRFAPALATGGQECPRSAKERWRSVKSNGLVIGSLVLVGLILSGCKGVPTPEEKQARAQLESASESYRPHYGELPLPVLTTNSSLADLVTFALLNQPKVEAAYYDWAASVERITVARSKPDPQLTFQMDIQDVVTSVMPGFMMGFPGPGKLRAAGDVASAQSQARYFAFKSAALESSFDIKRAYYQRLFLEEKIRVNRQVLNLLNELALIASAQNEVGKGTLQDILRAEIEADRLKTELASLEDSRTSLAAQFKGALGLRPIDPPPPWPAKAEFAPAGADADQVLEHALANNMRLQGLNAEVRAAEAAIVAANKGRVPDFNIGLMADAKMSPVLYRPLGTMTLPIWQDKISAQIAEAHAAKNAAAARLSAEQISLVIDLAERSFRLREANRTLTLLETGLLPKARQSLVVARSGYLSGRIDFFNLIDTERTLLSLESAQVETRAQRELAIAELSLIAEGMSPSVPGVMGAPGSTPSAGASQPTGRVNGGM